MQLDEHKFQDKFVEYMRNTSRSYVHINVGSMMSSGQPDLTIINDNGFIWYAELKVWKNKNLPSNVQQIKALLRGPQTNVITNQLWGRKVFAPIVTQLSPDLICVVYKDFLGFARWKSWFDEMKKVDSTYDIMKDPWLSSSI